MPAQTMNPGDGAAVHTEIKIESVPENSGYSGNSGKSENSINSVHSENPEITFNTTAPLTDAPEIPAGEQTAQTGLNTSETTHYGETVRTVSIETAPEPAPAADVRITPEQLVNLSNGKTAAPLNQPDQSVPAKIEIQTGTVNNTAPVEAGNSVNITAEGIKADNTAPAYIPNEAPAEAASSNAGTVQNADTKNSAVEANILFSRTQREIIEGVKISNSEMVRTADNTVSGELTVNHETVAAHAATPANPETGAIETSGFGLTAGQADPVNAPAPQQAPVENTDTAVKPQSHVISAETEIQPESGAHNTVSEKGSGETTAVSQSADIPKTAKVLTPESIDGNKIAPDEAVPPEPETISTSAQTVKPVTQSAGDTPEIHTPQDEAIAAGFSNAAENTIAKKTLETVTDSSKNTSSETDSGQSGTMMADAVEMNAHNEFGDSREFTQNTNSSPEQFAGNEKANIDNFGIENTRVENTGIESTGGEAAGIENANSDGTIFGVNGIQESIPMESIEKLAEQSGSTANTAQAGEINETKIFESIVRQARFMTRNELSRADIQLDPPHLGKLRIEIVTENSKITGRITVDSPEVKDIIQNSISELRENLAQSGLKVDSFDVNIGHNNGSDLWERAQKFKLAQNNTNTLSASQDISGGSAVDPLHMVDTVRTVSEYSESFDVVV
ncbi:flagellar hook-length control protein FliK [Candidatus Latescibacterota bacterium]